MSTDSSEAGVYFLSFEEDNRKLKFSTDDIELDGKRLAVTLKVTSDGFPEVEAYE